MKHENPIRLGTVVCRNESPNVRAFSFVIEGESGNTLVRRGQFVSVPSQSGTVIARVSEIIQTNRYFRQAEAVREYQLRGEPLRSVFPTDRWQYAVAEAQVLGLWMNENSVRANTSVSPGAVVRTIDDDILYRFLGLEGDDGLNLGTLVHHAIDFSPSVDSLLSKHLAVLAMSGAGKSYFVSVLLEEMLSRSKDEGRLATVVIDVHGEYSYLKEITAQDLGLEEGAFEIEHIRGTHIQIPVSSLSADAIGSFVARMSSVQRRELRRIISIMSNTSSSYSLRNIIDAIRDDQTINKNTKEALIGWLINLEDTHLFGKEGVPYLPNIVRPGKVTIVDLSDFISLKKKQIIVSYLVGELLYKRRQSMIPPFLLVLEEAHQFCPESRHELALPKSKIETIAREGRKFFALLCLISQRPVKLSTTVLSQCSNQAVLRCTNPYDLEHIGRSSEGIDRSSLDAITTLDVGEALFIGNSVTVPTFVKIRKRKYNPIGTETTLSDAIRQADKV
jgi:hypothetical protein